MKLPPRNLFVNMIFPAIFKPKAISQRKILNVQPSKSPNLFVIYLPMSKKGKSTVLKGNQYRNNNRRVFCI